MKTEFKRIQARELTIKAEDLQPHAVESLQRSIRDDKSLVAAKPLTQNAGPLPLTAVEPANEPKEPLTAVDAKVLESQTKFQRQHAERQEKLRQRLEEAQASADRKKKEREEAMQRLKYEKEAFKTSDVGQAATWLQGIDRDLIKCQEAITDTGTCGMAAGFAREWRNSLSVVLRILKASKASMSAIVAGKTLAEGTNEDELRKAVDAGVAFKKASQNYRAAKRLCTVPGLP